jgi:thiol-disulfide isomerase/thioredoxin
MFRILTVLLVWAAASLAVLGGEGEFRGRIVDDEGRPVPGIVLSPLWAFPDSTSGNAPIQPEGDQPTTTTDGDGLFVIEGPDLQERDWLALDATGERGVLIFVVNDAGDPQTFTLEPLQEFHGAYAIEAAGSPPATIGTWVKRRLGKNWIATCEAWSDQFSFKLPPGEYNLFYSNGDLEHRSRTSLSKLFELMPGDPTLDLGRIRLKLPRVMQVSGTVLDPDGAPAAGATVGRFWLADDEPMFPPVAHEADEGGNFSGKEPVYQRRFALLAMNDERTLGGLAHFDPAKPEPLTIRLQPLIEVSGRLTARGSKKPPKWTNVSVSLRAERAKIARCVRDDGTLSLELPPGDYDFFCHGADLAPKVKHVVLQPDSGPVDLGTIELRPTVLVRKANRRAPKLSVTAARGVTADIELKQLRGKWVALEFWGHWCGPCVRDTLPRLARLYRRYEEKRERFEVIAFHDTTVKTFDELNPLLEKIAEDLWNGEPLPFPILLDSTGETIERYGITSYPTLVLIDPEGRIVPESSESELEKILRGL